MKKDNKALKEFDRLRSYMQRSITKKRSQIEDAWRMIHNPNLRELWGIEDKGVYLEITLDQNTTLPQFVVLRQAFMLLNARMDAEKSSAKKTVVYIIPK